MVGGGVCETVDKDTVRVNAYGYGYDEPRPGCFPLDDAVPFTMRDIRRDIFMEACPI